MIYITSRTVIWQECLKKASADQQFQTKLLESLKTKGLIPAHGQNTAYNVLSMKLNTDSDTALFNKVCFELLSG